MKTLATLLKTATVALVFCMAIYPLTADAGRFRGAGGGAGGGIGFVDANQDGINDNFIDADGDGVCDLTGLPVGSGGFIDVNEDGVNDNFVDADGDGLCDLTGLPVGTGTGSGFRGGRN